MVASSSRFPEPDFSRIIGMLRRLAGPVDAVIDTDTYNEIDDQYALAYLVKSAPQITVRAMTAAPFYRNPSKGLCRSKDPADGMERSYQEILHVLSCMGRSDLASVVYRGATRYLPSEKEPVPSEAVDRIIALSQGHSAENPLYVVAIGAITNIASVLLTDPSIVTRIVVVWLGGHGLHIGLCSDFNMEQDIAAARVVFGSGVPLVQFPCLGVVSEFRFSKPELEYWFRGKNALCEYLIDNTYEFMALKHAGTGWSKPLWDVTTVCWLKQGDFFDWRLVPSPIPEYDKHYGFDGSRHPIAYVYYVKKDAIIRDLAETLCRS